MSSNIGLSISLLLYGSVFLFFYTVYGAVYRLYLSPVAKIPGPKLAAVTFWYQFYYDVIKRGQYTWKIVDLHRQYGPIVRINPYEVHISDPDFYDQLYTGPSKKSEKWKWSAIMFGTPQSVFGTIGHDHHRIRRGVLNHFFSKQAVVRLGPNIQVIVDNLCSRLRENHETKQPIILQHIYSALTTDVITEYCFASSNNCLGKKDLDAYMTVVWTKLSEAAHMLQQFPWMIPMVNTLPAWAVKVLNPPLYEMVKLDQEYGKQINDIRAEETVDHKDSHIEKTIFHQILNSNLDPRECTSSRLIEEARTLIGAGTVTTAHTLTVASFHLLDNPEVLQKLVTELKGAFPDPSKPPSLPELERLPYLSAVVNESLRFSGPSHRFQRVAPDRDLHFNEWVIPAGTPVSMTAWLMHRNPSIFPSPEAFIPERWTGTSAESTGSDKAQKRLDRYLAPFGKGTRACLGMNLALAEIYMTLANVFRRFEMELYETTRERDVDIQHDFINAIPSLDSLGVRVMIKAVRA